MKKISAFLITAFILGAAPAYAEVQKITSPKGITAWLVEDKTLPVISMAFAWTTGIEEDPADKQGLSYLAAGMLTKGAGADDDNAFQNKLQQNAISLGFSAARDEIGGSVRSLKETWPVAEALLKEALYQPRFDPVIVAREKTRMLSTLNVYRADPEWILSRLMFREIFSGHPYSTRTLGTEQTVAAITDADLKNWHKRLDRKHLIVSVTGAIDATELGKVLDNLFADLPADTVEPAIADLAYKNTGLQLAKQPGSQSALILVRPGLHREDPDWYTAEVMNYIFGGGGFSSRLTAEIREKQALTYGISSGMMEFEHAALYSIQASTRNDSLHKVLELIGAEEKRMTGKTVTPEELQAAKDYLVGSYALGMTSTMRVAEHNLELQRQHLPVDEQEKRAAAIKAVTAEQVQKMAQRLLAGKPSIFVVGAPQDVKADKVSEKID